MAITRFENVDVNDLTFSTNQYGEYETVITKKFTSRPLISDVKNSLAITDRYRIYQDLIQMKFNYTPWMKDVVDNQNLYSVTWRGKDWRITDCLESNDRMSVTLMCYRNDPATAV
jgi:hypothetical protein